MSLDDVQLFFNPGTLVLGIAMGVLGLVLLLSLIVSYAYSDRTLRALAAYLLMMVAAIVVGERLDVSDVQIQRLLLIAGPAVVAAFMAYLLKNRRPTPAVRAVFLLVSLVTLAQMGLVGATVAPGLLAAASWGWCALVLAFSVYLIVQSRDTAGPWTWWCLLGHLAGLATAAFYLTGLVAGREDYWPVVLMLLVQVPPVYLSLVWRSRLLNESRLRSISSAVTDPLTGLATTMVLVERLMRVMSRTQQSAASRSALFLIEVQNWQGLLNELGEEFSEKLTLEAAMRLRRSIGDNDLAARIGGGHFAVMAQGLPSEEDINSLATRLVVSGLRIDSPLLEGVEFKFRVIVCPLTQTRPLALPQTHEWLADLTAYFRRWPGTHRSRSILVVTADELVARPEDT